MRLLALDQSSHTTGYAIFEDDKPVKISHFTYDDIDLGDRLEKIRKKIKNIIIDWEIDEVVFEDIQLQDVNGSKELGIKTFKILAEVFGVIEELLTEMKVPHTAILPVVWKATFKIAGKGRSQEKKMSQAYILKTYEIKCTEDEADATCIGAHYIKKKNTEFDWS